MGRFRRIKDLAALRAYLEQQDFPRLQMLLFVAAAGASGFLADWLLLKAGLGRMALRYPCAVAVAYLPFLALLRVWVRSQGVRSDGDGLLVPDGEDAADVAEAGMELLPSGRASAGGLAEARVPFPGGDAGGGGSLDLAGDLGGELAGDLDEGVMIVVVLAALAGLVLAVGYLVWQAPAIFAELLLDGALSAGLYRRLRKVEAGTFLGTAFRKTFPAFAVAALLVGAAGWAIQAYDPSARTLRGAWSTWMADPS